MAATPRAPKQWCLTKTEIVTTFENWRQNLVYTLSLDAQFAPFLVDGATWLKKTKADPLSVALAMMVLQLPSHAVAPLNKR